MVYLKKKKKYKRLSFEIKMLWQIQ